MFWPGLAQKPQLWLGLRWLRLSGEMGQAKATMAWPQLGLAQATAFDRENRYLPQQKKYMFYDVELVPKLI